MENNVIRVCSRCNGDYEHYGQRSSFCRPCKREYDREYHNRRSPEKKARKQELQAVRTKSNRQYLYDFYKSNPCSVCGEARVATLQLDHINPRNKVTAVSNMMDASMSRLKEEVSKCRVLCANCHSVRTAEQGGWYEDLR